MKISINEYKHKAPIKVRRITPQRLCEEQLTRINNLIQTINADLRSV